MKIQKIHLSLLAAAGISMFWVACQKENKSVPMNEQETTTQSFKALGAVADNPDAIRKVPIIMSTDFTKTSAYTAPIDILMARGGGGKGGGKPGSGGTTGDAVAPTVSFSSPVNGATVSGTTGVQVNASDNVGVSSIELYIDGALRSSVSGSSLSYSWNTGNEADGNHYLTSIARDASGNQASAQVTVSKGGGIVVLPPPPSGVPSSYKINMPAVGYQGSEGSCVTFAVVYYALSAEQYKKSGAGSYNNASNVFSPEFVYNQTKASSSCSSGSSMINTLNFLYSKGSCTWQSMPYSSSDGCTTMPNASQTAEAANYRISNYSQVMSNDQTAIKTLLSSGHPLAFTFTADANFYNAGPGYIFNSYSSTFYGPHAITLCGYDDSKKAYLAINQWGTGWGDAGYIWIDYNFFTNITGSAYTLNY